MKRKFTASCHSLLAIALLLCPFATATVAEPIELMRAAVRLPCETSARADPTTLAERLPSVRSKQVWVRYSRIGMVGQRLVFRFDSAELAVQYDGRPGRPHQVAARYVLEHGPHVFALTDATCTVHTARRLHYDAAGRPDRIETLDSRLDPVGLPIPLNPPVPAGTDPGGIPVALLDTGVNYLLPEIAERLARAPDGRILGHDYWDLDHRPFDVSPVRDSFFPEHHGTLTASLLLKGAPAAKLVPYRYPRGNMARMGALIEDAAAHGVRVVNVSLASRVRRDWSPFLEAARRHPEMLFVVAAGNFGRNIEVQPTFPAALPLDNMVVVTSATASGELAAGANWGPRTVHLMAQGEAVEALGFDGRRQQVSGSSYAAARISALAACLLATRPEWSTAALEAAIFAHAQPDRTGRVAQGLVPNEALENGRACATALASGRGDD